MNPEVSLSMKNSLDVSTMRRNRMYVIKLGKWGIMGTQKHKYSRVGYIHIPYIFGGISIPVPIARREKL